MRGGYCLPRRSQEARLARVPAPSEEGKDAVSAVVV
jgi:hypothetical protein